VFAELLLPVLIWLLTILAISIAWLPLSLRLFKPFVDRGVCLNIPFSIAATTLVIWYFAQPAIWSSSHVAIWRAILLLLAFLTAAYRAFVLKKYEFKDHPLSIALLAFAFIVIPFLPIFNWGLVVVIGLFFWIGVFDFKETIRLLKNAFCRVVPIMGLSLFLFAFIGFAFIRAQVPEITWDLSLFAAEKMGNFMHLNSILRSTYFPPHDAWSYGLPSNYYYGGHLIIATLTQLSFLKSKFTFNLGLCLIVASSTMTGFVFLRTVFDLLKSKYSETTFAKHYASVCSALFAILLVWGGNLDGVVQTTQLHETASTRDTARDYYHVPIFGQYAYADKAGTLGFDFWRSSRTIHGAPESNNASGTITEFPSFTALLGDLHPHHLASPFLLFVLTVMLVAFTNPVFVKLRWKSIRFRYLLLIQSIVTALILITNLWDVLFLFSFFAAFIILSMIRSRNFTFPFSLSIYYFLTILFSIPFLVQFTTPTSSGSGERLTGIHLLLDKLGLGLVDDSIRTHSHEYLIHFWPVLIAALALPFLRSLCGTAYWILGIIIGFLLFPLHAFLVILTIAGTIYFALTAKNNFIAALILSFGFTTAGVEFIFINDYYAGYLERYNTLFKFYYSVWPVAWFIAVYAFANIRFRAVQIVLLLVTLNYGLVYPVYAIIDRIQTAPQDHPKFTLDGLAWMKDERLHRGDYEFYEWAWEQPKVLINITEASPEDDQKSYHVYGRLASITGTPSLVGWTHHELQWRGWESVLRVEEYGEQELLSIDQYFLNLQTLNDALYSSQSYEELHWSEIEDKEVDILVVTAFEEKRYRLEDPLEEINNDLVLIYESENLKIYEFSRTPGMQAKLGDSFGNE